MEEDRKDDLWNELLVIQCNPIARIRLVRELNKMILRSLTLKKFKEGDFGQYLSLTMAKHSKVVDLESLSKENKEGFDWISATDLFKDQLETVPEILFDFNLEGFQ